jgi:hypothetical protein
VTPLHPVKFNKIALLQMENIASILDKEAAKTERARILCEAHNYLCRLVRPYNINYPDGVKIELLSRDYFCYKREPFAESEYGFYFLSPADGYIYIDKVIRLNNGSGLWETLPLI